MDKHYIASLIKEKKRELLEDVARMQNNLNSTRDYLFDSLDIPSDNGINIFGINQNQHLIDIKTGELKSLVSLYKKMSDSK